MQQQQQEQEQQELDLETLTYKDFTDSKILRGVLLHLLNNTSRYPSIKVESFLNLAIPLLNISIIGRFLYSEQQLKELLKIIIAFYSTNYSIEECVKFMLKVAEFEFNTVLRHTIGKNWFSNDVLIAIESITMLLLNVKTLSTDVKSIIQKMNRWIEDKSNFEKSLYRYFTWLNNNKTELRKSCLSSEVIESIDRNLRAWIKGEIYENQRQIIQIYHMKYRDYLQNIRLPALSYINHDIPQCLKDISREIIYINGQQINNVVSNFEAAIHGHIWDIFHESKNDHRQNSHHNVSIIQSNGLEFDSTCDNDEDHVANKDSYINIDNNNIDVDINNTSTMSTGRIKQEEEGGEDIEPDKSILNYSEYPIDPCFSTINDFIYSHVLTAASRTVISGDTYNIVNDLYGDGEHFVLCPNHNFELRIDIFLSKDIISIEMKEAFDFHDSRAMLLPVISFSTRTITTIRLNELLHLYNKIESTNVLNNTIGDTTNKEEEELVFDSLESQYLLDEILQEEDKICFRKVCITPFLGKKEK